MSATILRNLIGSVLKIKATSIILSGEIAPKTSFTGNSCWSSQTTENFYQVWGFSPQQGLVELHITGNYQNCSDGSASIREAIPLCDVPGIEEFIFFIVKHETYCSNENRNNDLTYTLYKAPNFKEHWNKINNKDLARWEQWLKS